MKILIDNGHGAETNGKRSPDSRIREWQWNRIVAKKVLDKLNAEGLDAELVTPEDFDVTISKRVSRINDVCRKLGSQNVLLVSIHINADGLGDKWTKPNGCSVFVSKNAGSKSKAVAKIFTQLYGEKGLLGDRSVPTCGYWTWSWTTSDIGILRSSYCPAVLTENMFMTNMADVNFLASEAGKEKIANLHVEAIKRAKKEVFGQ